MPIQAQPLEQVILDDIRRRTGLTFALLGAVDTRNAEIARAVLPVLVDWPAKLDQANYRGAIYALFHTPHARPYFEQILEWWKMEEVVPGVDDLTPVLSLIAGATDAKRLWSLCRELPQRPWHYMLLAKLASFPEVASEVKDELVRALREEELTVGDQEYISKVDDSRIRKWFEGQLDSPNRYLRALAKRVVEKGKHLPKGISYMSAPPDRRHEIFSTEVDLEDVVAVLRSLSQEYGLKIPAAVRKGGFLSRMESDRWAMASVATKGGDICALWYRLEDEDVVEIALIGEGPSATREALT